MPLILFSFVLQTETQEAAIAGNVPPQQALNILQQLVIAQLVKDAQEKVREKEKETEIKER